MRPARTLAKVVPTATAERLPLFERAFRTLRKRILTGEIGPGSILSEVQLARELGMSRTPVREALVRLTVDGFAQRFPGRGVIVLELGLGEILDVFEVQACLEQYTIQRIFETGRVFDRRGLEEFLHLQREAVERGDTRQFLEHDRRMHLSIVNHLDNSKLKQIMQNASDLIIHGGYRALRSPGNMLETLGEHELLVRALAASDMAAALEAS